MRRALAVLALALTASCSGAHPAAQPAPTDLTSTTPSPLRSVQPSLSPSPRPSPSNAPLSPCRDFPTGPTTMTIAGRTLRVASPVRPSARVPVVLALAGYDQSAATLDSIAGLTTRLGGSALVLVAQGVGQPLAWQFKQGQTRDVDWLTQVVRTATSSCGDPSRVEIAGLSDGGVMAVRASCSIGVAALVTSSANADPPDGCRLPGTMLAEHGTDDSFDPYDGDGADIPPARDAIAQWAQAGHCTGSGETGTSVRRLVYTGCTAMSAVELVTLQGAPHGWPTTAYDLTSRLLGQLPAGGTGALAAFSSSVSGPLRAADLPHSWHSGCPVSPAQLRKLSLTYYGFDGVSHQGTLVVNADSTTAITSVFAKIYAARYPIRQMQPVDAYDGSDDASTTADNTAGFNCRQAVGGSGWSQHAYGHAIDIDPVENPYVDNGQVLPSNGAPYANRSQTKPGMVHPGDAVYDAFYGVGWKWGGYFSGTPDYQHFSSTGT